MPVQEEPCQKQDDHTPANEAHRQKGQLMLLQQQDLALGGGLED